MRLPRFLLAAAIGVNFSGPWDNLTMTPQQLSAAVAEMQSVGAEWTRVDFVWPMIETAPGVWTWTGYDALVSAFASAGIKILAILDRSPTWDTECRSDDCAPDPQDYAAFAQAVAARYPVIEAYEVWNEPNDRGFRNGERGGPDPRAYVAMMEAAYPAIKAVAPSAAVITGGFNQSSTVPGQSICASCWLEDIYRLGVQPYEDGIADHPYSSPDMPNDPDPGNNWQKMIRSWPGYPSIRAIMARHGDGAKPLWVTEWGAPTCGTSALWPTTIVSQRYAAAMLHQALADLARPAFSWAGPFFWFNLEDFGPESRASSYWDCWGLYDTSGAPKPAADAFLRR